MSEEGIGTVQGEKQAQLQRRKTAAIEVDGAETATVEEEENTVWECRRRKRGTV